MDIYKKISEKIPYMHLFSKLKKRGTVQNQTFTKGKFVYLEKSEF